VAHVNDPDVVAREYTSLDRLSRRRLDRTGWLREIEPVQTVLTAIGEAHPQRVLDAGSGSGEWAVMLTAPEITCVDASAAAVEAARARGLEAVQADIADLPFADGAFDVVMCNWVLYHLPNVDRGLAEIARVLQPGGRFVGAYDLLDHLDEVWSAVGRRWPADAFNGENGGEVLARHFASVERRDTSGEVLWENREALQSYLDAYSEMLGPLEAPRGVYPLRARRRNCVFVARKGDP
jgi:SAM-dependent methyltransferase